MLTYEDHFMPEDITNYFNPPNEDNITICSICSKGFQFDWDVMIKHMDDEHGLWYSEESLKQLFQNKYNKK